jgi:hypothetical protein
MNSTVYFGIFIIVTLILFAIVISWINGNKKKNNYKKLLKDFEDFVIRNHLTIDKKQKLHKNMIGIDRLNLKLVFLNNSSMPNRFHVIDLRDLSACRLIKQKNLSTGHISAIYLKCIFKKKENPEIEIPFYDALHDDIFKMMRLSKKASYWQKSITIFTETAKLSEQNT